MNGRRLHLKCAIGVLVLCNAPLAFAQQYQHPILDAPGIQQHRDYSSTLPFEHIDTLTGSLVLTFIDLVLPGNAGREVRFQRIYNSKAGGWTFGIAGIPLHIAVPPGPFNPVQGPQDQTPTIGLSDGSARKMAWSESTSDPLSLNEAISSDFWRFNQDTRVLSIPNGDTCNYEYTSNMPRVLHCEDSFGNAIDFTWSTSAPQLTVRQWIGGTSRLITLTYPAGGGAPSLPTSMSYAGRTWSYSATSVTLPEGGPGWTFTYDGYLTSVTTPHEGMIAYEYETLPFFGPEPPQAYLTPVVKTRTIVASIEHSIEPGTWTYTYDIRQESYQSAFSGETTIETPSGLLVYRHGWALGDPDRPDPETIFGGEAGVVPLVFRAVYRSGSGSEPEWVEVERETREYEMIPVLSWLNFGTLEPKKRIITRTDGAMETAYETTFQYRKDGSDNYVDFGDYHRAFSIEETGPAGIRTTDRSFQHLTSPYVLGLPESEDVTVGTEAFANSWTYADNSAFKVSEETNGIITYFGEGSYGNVASVTTANGKWISYENYRYGQPQRIRTPEYTFTRTIHPDGMIASETRAGRMTIFTYDGLGRPLVTQPPGEMTPTSIEYDTGGEWVKTTRGSSVVTTTLDGFGRPIKTVNAVGVVTKTRYDAEGRVVGEGYPFKPGAASGGIDIGTVIEYGLGRVTKRVNPDGSESTHEYLAGGVVKITDETGKETRQTWKGFGSPADAQLAILRDANGNDWSYEYDVVGRLKKVIAPDGKARTWTFNQQTQLLDAEQHPESGVTIYQYDAAGVLWKTTDANGKLTQYTYDGNERVETITADGRLTTIVYEVGSDNRESATNPSGKVTWRHHPYTGRLQFRQDTIDNKVFTTLFEYDNSDNLTALVYPSGRRVQYDHNIEGQPTRVWEPAMGRNYANGILYHPSGGVAAYSASNGITTTISYDASRYRISQITSGPMQFTYTDYDNTGNPLVINDSRGATYNQILTYDNLHRLSGAGGPYGSLGYSYDVHGNRIGAAFQYEPNTLRLANQNSTAFTYDNNGNTLTAGTASYAYTPQNQVELVTRPGVSVSHAYDADDQRVKSTSAGSTTYFIRGLSGELLTEWRDPGTATGRVRDYMYLGTRLLGAVAKNTTENPVAYNLPLTPTHRFATSWQVPSGSGDNASVSGITAAARKSSHPDMPRTGLRLGVQSAGTVSFLTNGPMFSGNNSDQPKQGGLFMEFEIERYPSLEDGEFLATDGGGSYSSSTNDLRLYVTPGGSLVLKHHGARVTPLTLWTSPPVERHTPHTLELRFEHNSGTVHPNPNPVWENLTSRAQVFFDGALVAVYGANAGGTWSSEENGLSGLDQSIGLTFLSHIQLLSPGPANGLLMNVWRVGITTAKNHGDALDAYGDMWRTTLLEAAGPGTYSQWTAGQPDWRARSAIAGTGGYVSPVTTNVIGNKISYQVESMASRGITGNIGVVLVGVRAGAVAATKAFIIRNGVETTLTDMVLVSAGAMKWYRVAESGWLPSDTIEIGVICGSNTNNNLYAVALLVEHNTPEPAPLTDTSARVVTVNYTGNGGGQTIDFAGMTTPPTALLVMPVNGVNSVEPMWWWESRQGAGSFTESLTSFGRIWPQKGKLHVAHATTGNSYNANGVNYVAIALFDPSGRYVIPFAVSKPAIDDDYTHYLRHPQSGELASNFIPDFVFGGVANGFAIDTVRASTYRGPGHVGDLTAKLGVASASDADRIQAIGAGTVQFGTLVSNGAGDQPFWAGRVSDGVSSTRLMAVTSYVGNGTASRNITLDLSGSAPVFALVVPTTTTTARVYRVTGDTTGRNTTSGNAATNSITAMGANQITVGIGLNAANVTYDVWTIATGLVTP